MRIYIPFCGIGLGHAFRALHIGKELEQRGHDVCYSTYDPTFTKLKKKGFKVLKTGIEAVQCQSGGNMDLGATITKTCMSLTSAPLLVKQHTDIIRKFKPDVILADTSFAALTTGKISGLPVVFITNQTDVSSFFPGKKYFALRAFIDASYTGFVKMTDRFLVPDLPLPYAVCRYNMKFFGEKKKFSFIGPISQKYPDDVKAIKFKKQTVLVSLGGSGLEADIHSYMQSAPDTDFIVVNSPFDKKEGNVTYKKYVKDYFSYLKGCDAFLTHGGHTSTMEAIVFGKPILGISLKGYAERENNLKGVKRNGIGSVVVDMKKELGKLSEYRKNAKKLQKLALKHNGATEAANIIEKFRRK